MNVIGDRYTDEEVIDLNTQTTLLMLKDRRVLKPECVTVSAGSASSADPITTDGVMSKEFVIPIGDMTELGKSMFPNQIGVLITMSDICLGINAFPVVQAFLKKPYQRKILIVRRITQSHYRDILDHQDGVEMFRVTEMLSPIPYHISQPKFDPYLTNEEIEETMNNYQMMPDRSQFQEMCVTDPVARYYNLDVGTIVRITRSSTSAVRSINFRKVVPSSSNMMFEVEY
jgi:DNA-directed RNA polymerase subunit H (RpoH/RPB5)